jgi:hypothetical protein
VKFAKQTSKQKAIGFLSGILKFYEKTGFIMNAELYNKKRKTISMRLDLYN